MSAPVLGPSERAAWEALRQQNNSASGAGGFQ